MPLPKRREDAGPYRSASAPRSEICPSLRLWREGGGKGACGSDHQKDHRPGRVFLRLDRSEDTGLPGDRQMSEMQARH
jgi:hypothetical protein